MSTKGLRRLARFELWRAHKLWWWHFVAANGEIVGGGSGEGYSRKYDAVSAILLFKGSVSAKIVEKKRAPR